MGIQPCIKSVCSTKGVFCYPYWLTSFFHKFFKISKLLRLSSNLASVIHNDNWDFFWKIWTFPPTVKMYILIWCGSTKALKLDILCSFCSLGCQLSIYYWPKKFWKVKVLQKIRIRNPTRKISEIWFFWPYIYTYKHVCTHRGPVVSRWMAWFLAVRGSDYIHFWYSCHAISIDKTFIFDFYQIFVGYLRERENVKNQSSSTHRPPPLIGHRERKGGTSLDSADFGYKSGPKVIFWNSWEQRWSYWPGKYLKKDIFSFSWVSQSKIWLSWIYTKKWVHYAPAIHAVFIRV